MNEARRPALPANRLVLLALLALAASVSACQGPFPQSTFDPATAYGRDLADLFELIFWWAVIVFVVVEVGVVYVLIRFRARPDGEQPKPIHGHTALEIAWTLAPAMIIVFIAVPTIQSIWRHEGPPEDGVLEIQAVGHQWWWEFRYPEYGIVTANDLRLPQGRPVEVQLSSADVIHSFWVPRLGGKRDMLLGRNNRLGFTPDSVGEFLGQCAEFCGLSHANMRFRVFVHEPAAFDAWVAAQQAPPAPPDSLSTLERRGLELFMTPRDPAPHSCFQCHVNSTVAFGLAGPNITHLASRSTIAGGLLPNTAENLTRWLRDPAAVKPGMGDQTANGQFIGMPHVDLSEEEIQALVAYLGSLQ